MDSRNSNGRRRARSRSDSDSGNSRHERDRKYRREGGREDRSARHSDRHRESRQERDPSPDRVRERPRDGNSSHGRRRDSRERTHRRERSRSPLERVTKRREPARSRSPMRRARGPLPSQDESFRGEVVPGPGEPPAVVKEKPNFKPTGLLAKEANTVAGTTTVLKYHEPPEARKPPPKEQWRMYVFKQKDLLDTIYLHQRSCWLFGRDKVVTDVLLEHPSISKQHAVIQFRHQTLTNEFGDKTNKVKPYLIDLESANGTELNGEQIQTSRYTELVDGDVVGFGDSEREYVLMLPPPDK